VRIQDVSSSLLPFFLLAFIQILIFEKITEADAIGKEVQMYNV